MIRRVIAALMLLLAGTVATAQVPFPQTLPANTVYGRLGIGPGPGQAIPFLTLGNQLFGGNAGVQRTAIADTNYTAVTTDTQIAYTSITAARTVTLPAASSFTNGRILVIRDDSGSVNSTRTISVAPNGGDTINGVNATTVIMSTPKLAVFLESIGTGWRIPTTVGTNDYVHSKNFGATGNNSTDDTANLQIWLDALKASKQCGFLDPGFYKTTSALTYSTAGADNLCIRGSGYNNSLILLNSTTQDGLVITTTLSGGGGPALEDFGIQSSVTASTGYLLQIIGPATSTGSVAPRLKGMFLNQGFNGLLIRNVTFLAMDSNYIANCINVCITISNTAFPANGDFALQSNTIIYGTAAIAGILIDAGSGLRSISNKFLNAGGTAPAVWFAPSVAGAYADLLLYNNSIENASGIGLKVSKGSATTLTNVHVVGNEISIAGAGANVIDMSDANAAWVTGVNITGNIVDMLSNNMVGVNINTSVNGFLITGNTFKSTLAATGLTGINVTSTAGGGNIAANRSDGVATPIANANTSVFASFPNNGHESFVGVSPGAPTACGTSPSTAAGSTDRLGTLTTGSTATTSCQITFAKPFSAAPRCLCTNAGGGTACSSATTSTTVLTLGYGSATSQTFNWECFGN